MTARVSPSERLRTVTGDVLPGAPATGIGNQHDVMRVAAAHGLPPIAVTYTPADNGRGGHSARWEAHSLTEQFTRADGDTVYGRRVFHLFGHEGTAAQRKAAARDEATAWLGARYGVTEWESIPGVYGTAMFPKSVAVTVKAALREVRTEPARR